MRSVRRRRSWASTTCRMCSGRLFQSTASFARLRIDVEAELGAEDDLIADALQRFAENFL